jgi:hypothetical protein
MNFGRNLAFAHICHKTLSFFFFFPLKESANIHIDKPNKQVKNTPWLPFIYLFHLVRAPNEGLINGYNFWACVNDRIIIRVFGIYHCNYLRSRA